MIRSVRIRNFKALRDTGNIRLRDLSVFIGNNGSGKSSVFEALRFLQDAFRSGLAEAFRLYGGIENVRHNQARSPKIQTTKNGFRKQSAPIEINVVCEIEKKRYDYTVAINTTFDGDFLVVEHESLKFDKRTMFESNVTVGEQFNFIEYLSLDQSLTRDYATGQLFGADQTGTGPYAALVFGQYVRSWQFLTLNAHIMGQPATVDRLNPIVRLFPEGQNVAALLRQVAKDPERLNAVVDKMKYVLPYASDIQTRTIADFEQKIELQLYEEGQQQPIPGWLFSSGTLRILAMLSVLGQKELPSVLLIDEIENGLDPRTTALLMEELKRAIYHEGVQVIATTHSPYFLDLLELRHIIVTERLPDKVLFSRPDDDKSLDAWKEKFSPGRLYTMNRLTR